MLLMKKRKVKYGNINDSLEVMKMIDKIYKNDKRMLNVEVNKLSKNSKNIASFADLYFQI